MHSQITCYLIVCVTHLCERFTFKCQCWEICNIKKSDASQVDSVTYSNLYQVKIINKTETDKNLVLKVVSPKSGRLQLATGQTSLKKQGMLESILIVNLNRNDLTGKSTNIEIGIYEGETLLEVYSTNFIGPVK